MSIIINITNEIWEGEKIKGVLGTISKLEEKDHGYCLFYLMENIYFSSRLALLVYGGEGMRGITVEHFPPYKTKSYESRLVIRWLGEHASELIQMVK